MPDQKRANPPARPYINQYFKYDRSPRYVAIFRFFSFVTSRASCSLPIISLRPIPFFLSH
jgi:hypothetical protein